MSSTKFIANKVLAWLAEKVKKKTNLYILIKLKTYNTYICTIYSYIRLTKVVYIRPVGQ